MLLTVTVEVPPRDREVLASWVRSPSIRPGLAQQARIAFHQVALVALEQIPQLLRAASPARSGSGGVVRSSHISIDYPLHHFRGRELIAPHGGAVAMIPTLAALTRLVIRD